MQSSDAVKVLVFVRRAMAVVITCAAGLGGAASASDTPVTYSEHIAPLMQKYCVQCHRPGQVAPMSLMTYDQVRPWARAISDQVTAREMPPFHAAGPIGRYENDLRLTEDQIALIQRWVSSGAKRGAPIANPAVAETSSSWRYGKPDLVIRFPKHKLVPSEEDPYVYLFSDYEFKQETWVRGYDWQFSDYKVAHHAIAFSLANDYPIPDSRRIEGTDTMVRTKHGIVGWLPGTDPERYPEGTARIIPPGTRVVAIFHYAPPTEEIWDEPKLGVYFASGEITNLYRRLDLITTDISIPPGMPDFQRIVKSTFEMDAYVTSFNVHMHYRGKTATIRFHYPDGTGETVFELPRFDFEWQREYVLKEPIFVPAGTVAEFIGTWDNSADNPDNPDPTAHVVYGVLSNNEMGNANISYYAAQGFDEPYQVVAGRSERPSPMLQAGMEAHPEQLVKAVRSMTDEEFAELLTQLDPEQQAAVKEIRRGAN